MFSRQSGLMLRVLNPGWSEWLCFLQQVNTSARLKVRWRKKTDLISPQAHLTQSIFPIQSSHSINKESPWNPFVELSHIKIWAFSCIMKKLISKIFSHSHEIQDGHILKINKTKKITKLYQIHIFTLSDLLIL